MKKKEKVRNDDNTKKYDIVSLSTLQAKEIFCLRFFLIRFRQWWHILNSIDMKAQNHPRWYNLKCEYKDRWKRKDQINRTAVSRSDSYQFLKVFPTNL